MYRVLKISSKRVTIPILGILVLFLACSRNFVFNVICAPKGRTKKFLGFTCDTLYIRKIASLSTPCLYCQQENATDVLL